MFLCVRVFPEISGRGVQTPKTPPVTALTGSVANEQRWPQSGRLQDPGDRGIDQSIIDSAKSGIGVFEACCEQVMDTLSNCYDSSNVNHANKKRYIFVKYDTIIIIE